MPELRQQPQVTKEWRDMADDDKIAFLQSKIRHLKIVIADCDTKIHSLREIIDRQNKERY